MRRFWDLMKTHKKASFGAWILILVAGVTALQWQLGGSNPILTQVLGAQAKKPDVTPPSVTISFPANNGVYGQSTWAGTVSGAASDATGVAGVQVAVQQQTGGKYWTGTAFTSSSVVWLAAAGTTNWQLTLGLPTAESTYNVSVQATDTATPLSNTSSPVTATFRVDRTVPPAPVLTAKPDNPSFDTKPHFAYSDTEAGVTFQCQLDAGAAAACGSSADYSKLAFADHTFTVWAFDVAGNRSGPASYSWTFLENKAFGITGSLTQPLYPGVSGPLDVTLSNPYNFTIRVTGISVQATSATKDGQPNPACRLADVTTGGLSAPTVDIPANATRTLSSYLATGQPWPAGWPRVGLVNTSQNQDACKGTTFNLSYSGTATKP